MNAVDLLIVGAGPAGMAAAVESRAHGLAVLLLDENAAPGGQVHRGIETRMVKDAPDRDGAALAAALRASGAELRFNATLWAVDPGQECFFSAGGVAESVTPRRILLCAGATERPLPIPGWTLPGVLTVGAAQIALKTAGLVPQGRVWLAGQGPLLWLYAVQALGAGGALAGILDLAPRNAWRAAVRHLPRALQAPEYLLRGLAWQRQVRRASVPVLHVRDLAAEGEGALQAVRFDGRREPAELLLLHDGVVPNTQVTRAIAGCAHEWDAAQRCWRPVLDLWGNSSVAGVMVAGDSGGIGGAKAAALSGRIAALEAAHALGRITAERRDSLAARLRSARARQLAPRRFLDTMFPPRDAGAVDDGVLLCRCEEVTAGRVRRAVAEGCLGSNQVKAFTRAGMGACQGRICGPAVHAAIAAARGVAPETVEPFRTRFPTKPLTLGELAALAP